MSEIKQRYRCTKKRSNFALRKILKNIKNKKEDDMLKSKLSKLNAQCAEPRAPKNSKVKERRLINKKNLEDVNQDSEELYYDESTIDEPNQRYSTSKDKQSVSNKATTVLVTEKEDGVIHNNRLSEKEDDNIDTQPLPPPTQQQQQQPSASFCKRRSITSEPTNTSQSTRSNKKRKKI